MRQVYAPASDLDDETVEMFYEAEKAMDKKACSGHIVMGDFNAKIGLRNINENMNAMGSRLSWCIFFLIPK